jgi:2-polyprenyl-3-methyl-5-hydroxy-6-metoxy-1,4-benzoquinol methylase
MDRYVPDAGTAPNDLEFIRWDLDRKEFPVNVSQFDQILMLDIIEHLKAPEEFMEELRFATGRKRPELILTTANIGFFLTRLALLCGNLITAKKASSMRRTRAFSPSDRSGNCSNNPTTKSSRCAASRRRFLGAR